MQDQLALERIQIEKGYERSQVRRERNLVAGNATFEGPEYQLLRRAVEPTAAGIQTWIDHASSQGGRSPHSLLVLRDQIQPKAAALITCRAVLDYLHTCPRWGAMCASVGSQIETELVANRLRREAPGVWRRLLGTGRLGSHKTHLWVKRGMEWGHLTHTWWTKEQQTRVGVVLIDAMVRETGLVEMRTDTRRKPKTVYRLEPTSEAIQWITTVASEDLNAFPWLLPMTEEPKPWTGWFDGGYHLIPRTFIKNRQQQYLDESPFPQAMARAVNSVQATRWCINEDILEVALAAMQHKWVVRGLPAGEEIPLPPLDRTMERGTDAFKMLMVERAKIHEHNDEMRSRTVEVAMALACAKRFRHDPVIYFPMQIDWRGRVYSMPTAINPLGADLQRSLIKFAEAKPLTNEAQWTWLRVHGANMWGNDKVSYEERSEWVKENEAVLRGVAEDPFNNRFWWGADKPFAFLAWAIDYVEALESGSSSIPVAMDGSCSGLQHYSAMLRDEGGGIAVNLVPQPVPADIYSQVLGVVKDKLTTLTQAGDANERAITREWLASGYLSRNTVKQPTMTTPYSVTPQGIHDQIDKHTREAAMRLHGSGQLTKFSEQNGVKHVALMGRMVRESIGEVVEASKHAMAVLQDAAGILAKERVDPEWVTPLGLRVLQREVNKRKQTVSTTLFGKVVAPTLRIDKTDGTKDTRKNKSGIAPNVIHSLDATHLCMTVNAMVEETQDRVDFQMVHDSFGTHAADAPRLARILREQFVSLYEGDVLSDILGQMHALVPHVADWPEAPEYGELDLEQVQNSLYFFG